MRGEPRQAGGRPAWWAAAVLCALLAAGCGATVREVAMPVQPPQAFSQSGDAPLPAQWWRALGDPNLSALIEEALSGNFSLRGAWARLRQAQAAARKAGADLLPDVDGTAGASRSVSASGSSRTYTTALSLGVQAGYEVDLWRRVGSAHRAAELDAQAGAADLHAAAITLSAEIAAAWYQLVERRGQLRLLDEQIRTNREVLDVISLKYRRGQVSATDVLQQRQTLEGTRGDRVLVASEIAVLRHRLAALVGRAPGRFDPPPGAALPSLPPRPRAGVPAERVAQRPDVRAAWLRVRAADRRVAAAIADRFPALTLSAGASTTAEELRDLFDNWLASLAASLAAPLFDAGRRAAEVDRTRAVAAERLDDYADTVLAALNEIEDALVQEARQREYVASLRRQLALSRRATDQIRDNYTQGAAEFVRYLTAVLAHQALQRRVLTARRQEVAYRIDLYRALGGAWPLPQPPAHPRRVVGPLERLVEAPAPGGDDEKAADHRKE
jgi:NodT family efflux transporter outer membrane factor (OMF) lipoprotein